MPSTWLTIKETSLCSASYVSRQHGTARMCCCMHCCCCWVLGAHSTAAAGHCRSTSPAAGGGGAHSIKLTTHCCSGRQMGQTDKQTDGLRTIT